MICLVMFVISEEKLMRLFAEMYLGFERDLGDVLTFVGFLCGFLLLLSFGSWLQVKKAPDSDHPTLAAPR